MAARYEHGASLLARSGYRGSHLVLAHDPLRASSGNVASSLGITAGSGSAQIAHTGPPGAISATITTLSATTGLSFDAPFTPRMDWTTLPEK